MINEKFSVTSNHSWKFKFRSKTNQMEILIKNCQINTSAEIFLVNTFNKNPKDTAPVLVAEKQVAPINTIFQFLNIFYIFARDLSLSFCMSSLTYVNTHLTAINSDRLTLIVHESVYLFFNEARLSLNQTWERVYATISPD